MARRTRTSASTTRIALRSAIAFASEYFECRCKNVLDVDRLLKDRVGKRRNHFIWQIARDHDERKPELLLNQFNEHGTANGSGHAQIRDYEIDRINGMQNG